MTNKTFALSSLSSDRGAVSQTHRHVERPFQPQPLRHLPRNSHDIQPGLQ